MKALLLASALATAPTVTSGESGGLPLVVNETQTRVAAAASQPRTINLNWANFHIIGGGGMTLLGIYGFQRKTKNLPSNQET